MATVYIETTIPSYYNETRTDEEVVAWRNATRRWWNRHRRLYDLHTSQAVRSELARAPAPKAQKALRLIRSVRVLDELPEVGDIVEFYIRHRLMPVEGGEGDAYHLAMASVHSMDYLLTWNCRHLANANKIRHITVINRRLGLHVPIITTPLTLIPEDQT